MVSEVMVRARVRGQDSYGTVSLNAKGSYILTLTLILTLTWRLCLEQGLLHHRKNGLNVAFSSWSKSGILSFLNRTAIRHHQRVLILRGFAYLR